ncbi:LacI family DNA-binding transcriptional regulator [Acidipropionibacterium virtanenii]|uniref:HTH-type transcriptional regulator DegA n=1 Tax=Acidipropionibacterium virtanenii TaxID=2057246 RepID=A0A344UYA2_9ACTN|nr:LacI family DNA-binding transcriptional regulator [Acidipropionibacterium virtanenii]AXE40250.1 HTH-type transcriptional regulator DegA [Acidipropionibacterium virtanenii]
MGKNPTQSDVARVAGVSRGLVSLALSGSPMVAEESRRRIIAAAQELGYTRDMGAATLAAGRSQVLGVVLPDLRNPFFEGVVDAVQAHAATLRLLPLVATSSDDREREALILTRFRELRVAGVIMVSPVQPLTDLEVAATAQLTVLIGADVASESLDTVHVDEDAAARLVADHLVERGWRSVVSLSEHVGDGEVWIERRQEALATAAGAAGLPFAGVEGRPGHGASAALREYLPRLGERAAVVAHNDLVAIDALAVARDAGLRPGRDVAVIGFDDTYMAQRPEFDVTSVSQDTGELARQAMEALLERDGRTGRHESVVQPSLTVRSSS